MLFLRLIGMSSFEKLFAILTLLYTIIILLFYFVDSEELSLEDLESLVSDKYKIKLLINLHLIHVHVHVQHCIQM